GNANNTESDTYTINNATGNITLLLNNTAANQTAVYSTQTNASASTLYGSVSLLRGGSDVSAENHDFVTLGVGDWNYTAVSSGDQNHSSATITRWVHITQASQSFTALLNGNNANLEITYPQQVNASYSGTNQTAVSIYINSSQVNIAENYTWGAGGWVVNYSAPSNQNYSGVEYYLNLTINQATPVLTFLANGGTSNLSLIYPQQVNISATTTEGTVGLDKDSADYTSNNALNVTLGVGSYIFRANVSGNQNYSDVSYSYYNVTINQTSSEVNLTLNSTEGNITIESGSSILLNGTLITGDSGATLSLYNNGTLINEGQTEVSNSTTFTGTGLYNITASYVASQNYTASSETYWVNVTSSACTQVTSCQNLTSANTEYCLQNDVSTTGTCFKMQGNNITLDGNGYTVVYGNISGGGVYYGIYLSGYNDSTIRNISVVLGENSSSNLNRRCVYMNYNKNCRIENVNTSYGEYGVFLSTGSSNHTVINLRSEHNRYGVFLQSSSSNNFTNFVSNNNSNYGLYMFASSSNNSFSYFTMNSNNYNSIYLSSGSTNAFIHGTINGSKRNAIGLIGDDASNNIFNNITITNTDSGWYDLYFTLESINGTYLIDMSHIGNYSFYGTGGTIIIKDSAYGEIKFLHAVNGSGTNFTNDIRIGNNSVTVESDNNIGFNRSANITLYGSPGSEFAVPEIFRDGVACGDLCYNFTSLEADTVIFNVSYWTNYSIGQGSSPPQITQVFNDSMTNVAGGLNSGPSSTTLYINFSVYDANGVGDLNESTARINFTKSGEDVRENTTCSKMGSPTGNYANFSCTVTMWWWDAAGAWNITAYIEDNSSNSAQNDSTTFQVGSTTGFELSPSALTWPGLAAGTYNKTSDGPILMNNTGNKDISLNEIGINATDLLGEQNNNSGLWAGNFSIAPFTGGTPPTECNATATTMSSSVFTNITGAILTAGNYTINNGTEGQEQLYFCLKVVGSEITTQPYSTSQTGSWTIRILLVAVSLGGRRKRKKKVRKVVGEISIPLTIFSNKLGVLEAITKYMKENLSMDYHEIAKLLNRDDRTVWTSYNKAKSKKKEKIEIVKTFAWLPVSRLRNRKLTALESIVVYLKEKGLKYSEISKLLNRDQRNIWSIYSKAILK
ncbi:MAG: hypothetical protein ABIH92_00535, partial [Nanoarchaeota archaeon]